MRQKDTVTMGTLRMLLSSIANKEIEKRSGIAKQNENMSAEELDEKSQLTDEEVQQVISSEVKKRREAAEAFEKGGRPELAQNEKEEMAVLRKYLPEQLPEEEIRKLVKEAIEQTGAASAKDMGKVMSASMPKVKGRADGNQVNAIVKELLG